MYWRARTNLFFFKQKTAYEMTSVVTHVVPLQRRRHLFALFAALSTHTNARATGSYRTDTSLRMRMMSMLPICSSPISDKSIATGTAVVRDQCNAAGANTMPRSNPVPGWLSMRNACDPMFAGSSSGFAYSLSGRFLNVLQSEIFRHGL